MKKIIIIFLSLSALTGCQTSTKKDSKTEPVTAIVATANPLATQAGKSVLKRGGSAVDAAVAIEAMLSLVEPQSSGLAGGAYLVHYNASSKSITAYDGRETAPDGATPDMFLNAVTANNRRTAYFQAKNSGVSTGVPGVVAMLALAQKEHGNLEWDELFNSTITTAENGFAISKRLYHMYTKLKYIFPTSPEQGPLDAYQYFYDEQGQAHPVGHILKNPAYAKTLRSIAKDYRNFYTGDIAKEIVAKVNQAPRAGTMTMDDLANYQPRKYEALCSPYKAYTLCGPPPPSSWVAVAMAMSLLEYGPEHSSKGSEDPANWGLVADALRLSYADRDQYVADPAFIDIPLSGMLNNSYLEQRAKQIQLGVPIKEAKPGDPWAYQEKTASLYGNDLTNDLPSTTHFVVRDNQGNVVSMTASVESIFGSSRMAGGMMLNNQLTDFSFQPTDKAGKPVANSVQPGKRPRSSMSPTIVLDNNGDFVMATGSPGGNSIISYTVKSLVGVLDWQLTPAQAIALPNMVARGDKVRIESKRAKPELINGLKQFGFNVKESSGENSGLNVIFKTEQDIVGASDPRREGTVATITPPNS